jgi:lipopolysaccharide/colanic/teichoic acid biosynthesis glycosyltransferase
MLDRVIAALGLCFLTPVFGIAALAVVVESGRPVWFRQTRIGRHGKPFQLMKFRSMRAGLPGSKITGAGDRRVTKVGAILRRYKIDELPQLWNVLRGDMNLIGPRPEIPEYVDLASSSWKQVLAVRPGISDLATLVYRDEEALLGSSDNTERFYRDVVLPGKLALSLHYSRTRSIASDLKLLLLTVRYSLLPRGFDPQAIKKQFCCKELE